MTVQEMMRVLVELPHDMDVLVAVAEFEDRVLQIHETDSDYWNKRLVIVLKPEKDGFNA